MKILLTTDNTGGVWTYSLILAKGLIKRGIDVTLAIVGNPLSENEKREIASVPWYFYKSRQEWMDDPWADVAATGRWLMKLNQFIKPEIIHLNSYSLGSLPWNIPVIIAAHSCVLSWWEAVNNEQIPERLNTYRENVMKGIQAADIIVAPGNELLRSIEKYYGPLKMKHVIYNGGVSSLYLNDLKENYVFCMGRLWDDAKNIKLVLEAAPGIAYPVYIAGNTTGSEYQKIPPNVTFIGHVPPDEISSWLSKAAIYLLPVKYEPFGYTFLEAAFSGCAIITGDIESMHEIWGDCVAYTDPGDHFQLTDSVNNLMADSERRQSLGDKARKKALSEYHSEKMVTEYIKVYREIKESKIKSNLIIQKQ